MVANKGEVFMNEFLESNLDSDILLNFKFGEDNIIFKYSKQ